MARRFVLFFDEDKRELIGEGFYFDQRLSNQTVIRTLQEKCERQTAAWLRDPKKYVFKDCAYLQICRGERLEGTPETPLIELIHNKKEVLNEL